MRDRRSNNSERAVNIAPKPLESPRIIIVYMYNLDFHGRLLKNTNTINTVFHKTFLLELTKKITLKS